MGISANKGSSRESLSPDDNPKNNPKNNPENNPLDRDPAEPAEAGERAPQPDGSRIIGRVLPPAIRLWLQSQVEQVEQLNFEIEGRDRQILSGHIPGLAIAATGVIYQGLHLSHLDLNATGIQINLGQVLRGKALKLKQSFPVKGQIVLNEADLNASLQSPLLLGGLRDFLMRLSQTAAPPPDLQRLIDYLEQNPNAVPQATFALTQQQIVLALAPPEADPAAFIPLTLQAGLAVTKGRYLQLINPVLQGPVLQGPVLQETEPSAPRQMDTLQDFQLDLGSEVTLETLAIANQRLVCEGMITVIP